MRIGLIVATAWLAIGGFAAGQRVSVSGPGSGCSKVSATVVTVLAGPLNYLGVNLKIACETSQ
jgi:hypothetical protein